MKIYALFWFLIRFGYLHSFITPSKSEPECPGVKCDTVDPNTCRCIGDPKSKSGSHWPLGNYGLPASIYGCPEVTWPMKNINMTLSSNGMDMFWETSGISFYYKYNNDLYKRYWYSGYILKGTFNESLQILGPYDKKRVQLNFCVREDGDVDDLSKLRGSFCIYKIERHQCIDGYADGSITIKGYHSDVRGFRTNIKTNDGGIVISFCCRSDGNNNLSDMLPHTDPFVLLKGPTEKRCEDIADMTYTEDVFHFNQEGGQFDFNGTLPNMKITDRHVGIRFCVYQPQRYVDPSPFFNDGSVSGKQALRYVHPSYVFDNGSFDGILLSIGRPCYSSLYKESPTNNPKNVVDGGYWNSSKIFLTFTTLAVYRPWIQIDLQQFVQIEYVIMRDNTDYTGYLIAFNASKDQNFFHHGAVACFFGPKGLFQLTGFVCRRPVIGQYITLVLEPIDNNPRRLKQIRELGIYGQGGYRYNGGLSLIYFQQFICSSLIFLVIKVLIVIF